MTPQVIVPARCQGDDGHMNDTATNTRPGDTDEIHDPSDRLTTTIDRHLAGYCEPDAATRARLIAAAWSDDGSLYDPPFDGTGREAIAGLADVLLQHYPGHTFRRTTAVDTHHDRARYGWALVDPSGSPAVTGTDFARVDGAGKLVEVVGFFGDLTAS